MRKPAFTVADIAPRDVTVSAPGRGNDGVLLPTLLACTIGALLSATSVLSANAQAQSAARVQAPLVQELVVKVMLNGVEIAEGLEVLEVNGLGVLLTVPAFNSLKLIKVTPRIVQRGNADLVALSRTPGISVVLDRSRLELVLQTSAAVLPVTTLEVPRSKPVVTTVTPGAYVNYDASSARVGGQITSSAYVEAVAFAEAGSVVSQHLITNSPVDASIPGVPTTMGQTRRATQAVRLDTYAQRDFPETGARLRIGDSVTAPGNYGPAARFGGIQYGTEDTLDPRLITLPTVGFNGTASVPSSVDVFMNSGNLRRFNVPAGSFNIDNIPTVTGAGVARMVVRDLLGREVVIEQPFFNLPNQLRAGLSRYSVSAGWLRNNFGVASNDYGSPFAAGLWRYGISNRLTVEARAETQKDGPTGAGATILLPLGAKQAITASGGVSRNAGKTGTAASLAYQYTHTWFNVGLQGERRNDFYQLIGTTLDGNSYTTRLLGNLGVRLGEYGSLGLIYGASEAINGSSSRYASASYSLALSPEWRLSMAYNRSSGAVTAQSGYIGVNWLGRNGYYASTTASVQCDGPCGATHKFDGTVSGGSRSNGYEGFSWDASANRARGRVGAEWLTTNAAFTGNYASEFTGGGADSLRVGARGSLVVMDGSAALGRYVNDSAIMVKSADAAGLPLTINGSRGVRLDSRGVAVLTRFSAYDQVTVGLDSESIPLDMSAVTNAPPTATRSKSGVVVRLAATRTAPATFTLIDRQGKAMPTGVVIHFGGATTKVGLDGLVYVENIGTGGAAFARKNGSRCDFSIPAPPRGELQPYLGALTCELRHL